MWFPFASGHRPAQNSTTSPRRKAPSIRLTVDALEDRTVPAQFNVTTLLDVINSGDGLLSLREAVLAANATKAPDTIHLPAGTYNLSRAGTLENAAATGDLDITRDLKIKGAGAGTTIIDAAHLDRVFHVLGGQVTISGVTIQNGLAADRGRGDSGGGGINNDATLTVTNCTLSGNSTTWTGGGIDNNWGTLTVSNSTLSGNSATRDGGGIHNSSGTVTVTNSTLSGNSAEYGGGISIAGCFGQCGDAPIPGVSVTNSTLSGNSATRDGGGLSNFYGVFRIYDSTLSGNSANGGGGGIYSHGFGGSLENSIVSNNTAGYGGGIYNSSGRVTLEGCIVSNNTAGYGGGIYNLGTLEVRQSELCGNFAPVGADLYNAGALVVIDSIICDIGP
ncbi:MAG: hypothetical protein L0Z62_05345 [Gemmataceae bacterium]|nr:hypothetical protein [Gemmataceae bacterium]